MQVELAFTSGDDVGCIVSQLRERGFDRKKKTNIIHSHLKRRRDESRDKKRSTQWKAVCGKSARTV